METTRNAEEVDIIVSRWLYSEMGQDWIANVSQMGYDAGYIDGVDDVDCQQARDEAWQEARLQYVGV